MPSATAWPPSWLWLIDEAIPSWVKLAYSPRDSWKDKPFSKEDAQFFAKGVVELSELFTDERPRRLPDYFAHPKYRSGYLLYFVPLQASKFLHLYERHRKALESAVEEAKRGGVFKMADLGAGPGTASLALLMWLQWRIAELPEIELEWWDTSQQAMKDGRELVERFANAFPRLRGKVRLKTHVGDWQKAKLSPGTGFTVLGHVLNESKARDMGASGQVQAIRSLLAQTSGAGVLIVEPAARVTSQRLTQMRDLIIAGEPGADESLEPVEPQESTEAQASEGTTLWGPCLHAGRCPLNDTRDWCHFSVPIDVPGQWFKKFSEVLGSQRQWIKFSYLWFASSAYPAPAAPAVNRRVISDLLVPRSDLHKRTVESEHAVLICQPDAPEKLITLPRAPLARGDIIRLHAGGYSLLEGSGLSAEDRARLAMVKATPRGRGRDDRDDDDEDGFEDRPAKRRPAGPFRGPAARKAGNKGRKR